MKRERRRWPSRLLVDPKCAAWCDVTRQYGATGARVSASDGIVCILCASDINVQRIAACLTKNEFTKVEQLSEADDPSLWIGSDYLCSDSLDCIRSDIVS